MKKILSIVVAGLLTRSAAAQEPEGGVVMSLALDAAITMGLSVSHRLEEATARADAALALAGIQHAATVPHLMAQGGYSRTNHVEEFGVPVTGGIVQPIYPDIPDNVRARLQGDWSLYTGGRIEALERAARTDASAMSYDVATLQSDLRLEITSAYWHLVTAAEALRVTEEALARTRAHLQDVRNRLAAGLVPPNEVLTTEARESQQEVLRIQAEVERNIGEADLARLIGVPPGTIIRPTSPLEAPESADLIVQQLVELARQQRPDRAAILERLSAAADRKEAATAGRKPIIAVVAGVDYARPNPRIFPRSEEWRSSWDASVNVSVPLLDGGRTGAEVAEATAGRLALEARLAEFDSILEVDLRRRVSELRASIAAIAAASQAVQAATEAHRVVSNRFAAGVATNTDVLDAEGDVLQAELTRTQAIASALLAEARLGRAVGR